MPSSTPITQAKVTNSLLPSKLSLLYGSEVLIHIYYYYLRITNRNVL